MNLSSSAQLFERDCSNRANIYRILADAFKRPESTLLAVLHPMAYELASYDNDWETDAERLMEYVVSCRGNFESPQIEHARLFVGPFQLEAPPYSSVYLDKQPLVMGDATQQAIDYYVQAGLDPSNENKEPPDHICTELEFMYYLLFQTVVEKDRKYSDLAGSFLSNHLSRWVPKFTGKIIKGTEDEYYSGLANLLDTFIQKERERWIRCKDAKAKDRPDNQPRSGIGV